MYRYTLHYALCIHPIVMCCSRMLRNTFCTWSRNCTCPSCTTRCHLPSEYVLLHSLCERVQPSRKLSVTKTLSHMFYRFPVLKISLFCRYKYAVTYARDALQLSARWVHRKKNILTFSSCAQSADICSCAGRRKMLECFATFEEWRCGHHFYYTEGQECKRDHTPAARALIFHR